MNLAQMLIACRNLLMAGSASNANIVNDPFWNDTQLQQFLNQAQRKLWLAIRRAHQDYFTRTLRTTESALTILGQTFTPSSLRWSANTRSYTLPPDFVRMVQMTDLDADTGANRIRVVFDDVRTPTMRGLMNEDGGADQTGDYYGDILNGRTLIVRPIPGLTRDWEFIYERRLPPLRNRTTGTATVSNGGTTVTFSSSALANRFIEAGDELIFSTSATAPTADPSLVYPVIESVDSATQVTLEGPFYTDDGADRSAVAYIASSVSEIPVEYHDALVHYAVAQAFKIGPNAALESAMLYQGLFDDLLVDIVGDAEIRQTVEPQSVTAYLEDAAFGIW